MWETHVKENEGLTHARRVPVGEKRENGTKSQLERMLRIFQN